MATGRRKAEPAGSPPQTKRGRPKRTPQTTPQPDKADKASGSQAHHAAMEEKGEALGDASALVDVPVEEESPVLDEVVPTVIPPTPTAPLQAAVDEPDTSVTAAEPIREQKAVEATQQQPPSPQPPASQRGEHEERKHHDNTAEQMHALAVGAGAGLAVLLAIRLLHAPTS